MTPAEIAAAAAKKAAEDLYKILSKVEVSHVKIVDGMIKERNLMKEMSEFSKKIGVDYEKHTKSIGSAVKDLTTSEKIQAQILKNNERNKDLGEAYDSFLKNAVEKGGKLLTIRKQSAAALTEELIAQGVLNAAKMTGNVAATEAAEKSVLSIGKVISELKAAKAAVISAARPKVGKRIVEDIEQNRRENVGLDKKQSFETMKDKVGGFLGGDLKKQLMENDFVKGLGLDGFIKKLSGPVAASLKVVFEIIKFGFETFKQFDESAFTLRKSFGAMGTSIKDVEKMSQSVAREYASIGVTVDMAVKATTALADSTGNIRTVSEDMVKNVAAFSAQLGISEEHSAGLLKSLSTISGKTIEDASAGMMGFTQSMTEAAGIPLGQVMQDLANVSDSVRSTFRGNTTELIKATVEARRMGLSLESMGKTSENLLDFHSSVNAEMEASVLLGQNINLMEARRAAFNGDLVKQNQEILKVVKSVGDFEKLNMFQKKALAAATGKSVEELQTMLQREKQIESVRAKGSGKAYDALMLTEKLMKAKAEEAKNEGLAAERAILKESNQARMNVLQQQFNQMMMDLAGPVMDILEPLMSIAVAILPPILKMIGPITILFGKIFMPLQAVLLMMFKFAKSGGIIMNSFAPILKIGFKILGVFGKWLTPIGWVITAIQVVAGVFKSMKKSWDEIVSLYESGDVGGAIMLGIKAIGGGIVRALLGPFEFVFDWIMEKLGGKSPSKIGLAIVDGLKSVGGMIWDVLISPFKMAYDFITGLFGKIPEFISSTFKKGMDFAMKLPGMGLLTKAFNSIAGNTESPSTVSNTTLSQVPSTTVESTKTSTQSPQQDVNQLILNKLTELTELMKNGAIAVNMDGRKVSEALSYASR